MKFSIDSKAGSAVIQPSQSVFSRLRQRLKNRPDSEHEMTPNRLAFAGIVSGYLCVMSFLGNQEAAEILDETYAVFIAYFVVSLLIFAHILYRPGTSVARRLFAIVHDLAMISYAAQAGGMASGFFYPLYLWTVFGNGFRFGIPYLYVAMVVSLIGFSTALTIANYWNTHFGLSVALIAGLVLLPIYVSALIRKLSEAKRQAENANKAKSLFLASVSHELRTPLNAIIGLSDLLHDQVADREQRGMTQTIAQSGRSLLRLINTVLDFSRAEAGQVTVHRVQFDLYAAAAQIRSMLCVQAEGKGVALSLHIDPGTPRMILADRRFLDDVLMNLVANAVKFTDSGFVLISISAAADTDGQFRLRFMVTDTGIGIAPEAQSRIFELFTQANETIIDQYGGTGLGLTICKRLVELQRGAIGLDSALGKGSTFWFEIDVKANCGAKDVTPTQNHPVLLLSQDHKLAGLAAELSTKVFTPKTITDARRQISALQKQNTASPIVFVDRSQCEQFESESPGNPLKFQGVFGASAVLVDDGDGPISEAMRACFVSVFQDTADRMALETALAIAVAISGKPDDDGDVAPTIRRKDRTYSVLVAEDNGTNQMVIAKILERAGHHATIVGNGEEALTALREGLFDIVLMDINMPAMNGIEATKLYRFMSLGNARRLPIIGLTADATAETQVLCEDAGMDACALKPIEPQALIEMIDAVVLEHADTAVSEIAISDTITPIATHPNFTPPKPEPLDLATLANLEKLGGREFVEELVMQFLADASTLLDELAKTIAEGDVLSFRDYAHALRSAAANVGAMNIFNLCLGWRDITQRGLSQNGDANLQALREEFDLARTLLKARSTALAISPPKSHANGRLATKNHSKRY